MSARRESRTAWAFCIAAIIAAGIVSRVVTTGLPLFDKYLGDALYAAMVYSFLRLTANPLRSAAGAMIIMTALEFFQLTRMPARLLASDHLVTRICARLLGVQFSVSDLLAYAAGISAVWIVDSSVGRGSRRTMPIMGRQ